MLHQLDPAHRPHLDIGDKQIDLLHPDAVQCLKTAARRINMADIQSGGSKQAA
ncbi:hypothetical protein D3C80_2175430 [compost metagenome]